MDDLGVPLFEETPILIHIGVLNFDSTQESMKNGGATIDMWEFL